MGSDWKSKLSFLDRPETVQHSVQGQALTFYKVSVGAMMQLRKPMAVLGKAIATLFTSASQDTGSVGRSMSSKVDGIMDDSTEVRAITPELAKMRLEAKQNAITELIECLADPANVNNVGYLIMDSLQDIFPRQDKGNPTPQEFMASMEAPTVVEMLIGVAKANKGLFGPLVGKLQGAFGGLEAQIKAQMNGTPGSTSRTASPGSSSEATTDAGSSPSTSTSSPPSTTPASDSPPRTE